MPGTSVLTAPHCVLLRSVPQVGAAAMPDGFEHQRRLKAEIRARVIVSQFECRLLVGSRNKELTPWTTGLCPCL